MPAQPGQPLRIFISCVSAQFKACRDSLASDLRAIGYTVIVQEDFRLTGFSLLQKLQEAIASCDRVIAILGDTYGWEPEVQTDPRRSYTQWEYHFALGERLAFPENAPSSSLSPAPSGGEGRGEGAPIPAPRQARKPIFPGLPPKLWTGRRGSGRREAWKKL